MSWVIVRNSDGAAVLETFSAKVAGAINLAKYRAVPIEEYLGEFNRRVKSDSVASPATLVRDQHSRKSERGEARMAGRPACSTGRRVVGGATNSLSCTRCGEDPVACDCDGGPNNR